MQHNYLEVDLWIKENVSTTLMFHQLITSGDPAEPHAYQHYQVIYVICNGER